MNGDDVCLEMWKKDCLGVEQFQFNSSCSTVEAAIGSAVAFGVLAPHSALVTIGQFLTRVAGSLGHPPPVVSSIHLIVSKTRHVYSVPPLDFFSFLPVSVIFALPDGLVSDIKHCPPNEFTPYNSWRVRPPLVTTKVSGPPESPTQVVDKVLAVSHMHGISFPSPIQGM